MSLPAPTKESPPVTATDDRIAYVDALRGIAALMVLVFHTVQRSSKGLPAWVVTLNEQGARGVQLFYVISAFTIFMTLHIRSQREGFSMRSFFVRRFFRIAPLFYCAMVFYLWLYGFGPRWSLGEHNQIGITPGNIISNIFFVNGFSPYWINSIVPVGWSVTVEMFFYLCVPLLFYYIRSLRAALWLTFGALLASGTVSYVMATHPLISDQRLWMEFLFQWFFNQMPIFCLGIVLFFLLRDCAERRTTVGATRAFALSLQAFSIFLIAGLPFFNIPFLPRHVAYGIAFLMLTYGLSLHPWRWLSTPLLTYFGKISYSVYLTQVIAIRLSAHLMIWLALHTPIAHLGAYAILVRISVVFLCAIGISTLTYLLIELPGQRLGARLIRRREAAKAAAVVNSGS